jgi:hypothetical protein
MLWAMNIRYADSKERERVGLWKGMTSRKRVNLGYQRQERLECCR